MRCRHPIHPPPDHQAPKNPILKINRPPRRFFEGIRRKACPTRRFLHPAVMNFKSITLGKLLNEHPERVIEFAVKGMLPKNPLGRAQFRKLHVYVGPEHPHAAQQPTQLEL